jgi:signal transduction histidine kinase
LVAQLQGEINLTSVVGEGTSVTVRFPLQVAGPEK